MPDVLGHQRDDRGQEHRQHRQRECRRLELRQSHPACGGDRRRVDVAEDQGQHIARDDGQEDRQPADDAAKERERRDNEHQSDESDQRAFLEIRLGGRRKVEPDQRDDRPRDHRRQRDIDPVSSHQVHGDPDDDQHDADRDQTAKRAAGAMRGHGSSHRRDHREARAQIARQPVAGDHQKQHGADAREEQGGRRREARQHRHQEGGAEHRHDVLGADTDGAGPAQSLVGGDHKVVVRWCLDGLPCQRDHGEYLAWTP